MKFDEAADFSEGLAAVKVGKKYGFIDETGKEIVPCNFDFADSFDKEGKALVKIKDRFFYIDKTGKEWK